MEKSKIELLRDKPIELRKAFLDGLTNEELLDLQYDWKVWARPKQFIPEGDWFVWMIMAGRSFGKTRTGAETIRYLVERGICGRIALIGAITKDWRDVMIEGESGILATAHPKFRPTYNKNEGKLQWPNGAVAQAYSGEVPESLRGPQHDFIWIDELAKMPYQQEVWDQAMLGLRLGTNPRVLITTTPRPTTLMKNILTDPQLHLTTGTMYENSANLPGNYVSQMEKRYEGTRMGLQELHAELLLDNVNSMFTLDNIHANRVNHHVDLKRIVVALDPAVTNNENSDETGIIVAGRGINNEGYILFDGSMKGTPNDWALKAIQLYKQFNADVIVAEVNQGGQMVETIISHIDPYVNYAAVRATRGKVIRAEPIAALYERNLIHHVGDVKQLEELETQMCDFDPTLQGKQKSPDRMDALVWALTELFPDEMAEPKVWVL